MLTLSDYTLITKNFPFTLSKSQTLLYSLHRCSAKLLDFKFVDRLNLSSDKRDWVMRHPEEFLSQLLDFLIANKPVIERPQLVDQLSQSLLYVDKNRPNTLLFIDRATRVENTMALSIFTNLQKTLPKELKAELPEYAPCKFIYDPQVGSGFQERGGKKLPLINEYKQPIWRNSTMSMNDTKTRLKWVFPRIIWNIFPDAKYRQYVAAWMLNALTSRNETALILLGDRGTGKSLFAGTFAQAWFGESNHFTTSKGLFHSNNKFNREIANCTLAFADEAIVTESGLEDLKRYFNRTVTLEGKNRDPEQMRLHANFILATNKAKNIFTRWDERRFSPVFTRHDNLDNAISEHEIADFLYIFSTDTEYRHACCWWFYHAAQPFLKGYSVSRPFKSEAFNTLVNASRKDWQLSLINHFTNEETKNILLSNKDFKQRVKIYVSPTTIKDFLADYGQERREVLATLKPTLNGGFELTREGIEEC